MKNEPVELARADGRSSESRLVVVSNRLPFNAVVENGEVVFHESAGGLVTGLASYIEFRRRTRALTSGHIWVGWPGSSIGPELRESLREQALASFQSFPVFLSEEEMEQFYLGFCNATIWPLFHYFPSFAIYEPAYWEQYKHVNQVFCDSLEEVLKDDDVVWVHDYHLMLLPRLLKARRPRLSVGFFLHIPFPSFEVFRLLPVEWRREILEGLLGADLVGFHTYEYTQHFLQSTLRILGYEHHMGQILTADHIVKADSFPIGIDFDRFASAPADPAIEQEVQELKKTVSDVKIILSVDRLDYSKGILNRLEGYEAFLELEPQHHGKIVLLMIVVPSRIGVRQYERMKRQIEEAVGKINGRFGRVGWTPVLYQYRSVPFTSLVAFYAASDICLVTPLRDGMNLVAKEYVATRRDGPGVLILSEMAGSAKELPEAITVNPNDRLEIARAIKDALETPVTEQKKRNAMMQRRLRRYDVTRWANEFLEALGAMRDVRSRIQAKLLTARTLSEIVQRFKASQRRVLFLDYDGTVAPLARYPSLAAPDETVLRLLSMLSSDPRNDAVIVSGRDRRTLDDWFGQLPIGIISEHGVWLKRPRGTWQMLKPMNAEWKRQLMPILETYADRLPGAFVEEKEHSIAWHYRLADPEQAGFVAAELFDLVLHLTAKSDVQVIQGNKVVEIRNVGVNKGIAALEWIGQEAFDFVLAAGDDATDEDLFRALADSAVSIRVGVSNTHAHYNVRSPSEVIDLLKALAQASGAQAELQSSVEKP
ncbi:MAG TPA: bifunctional alpha,alpha-trehalose-phosphate synthase (UDP-forming)/trehalose-phosphatase [Candidatus Eisenbacteria bacterium]|nr:bifunctional alpha,alpha-trehalose-phosphate synthase (UDP-forming)/trehalose-phosphatase [Candidatus Eisenbacteria bacterium]